MALSDAHSKVNRTASWGQGDLSRALGQRRVSDQRLIVSIDIDYRSMRSNTPNR